MSEEKDLTGSNLLASLGAIILPVVIEKALGGVGAALSKAGAEETLNSTASLPIYLHKVDSDDKDVRTISINEKLSGGCLIVVRGTFDALDEDVDQPTFTPPGFIDTSDMRSSRKKRLNDNGIKVNEISLIYEAAIVVSDDRTAIRYESRFLEIASFLGSRSQNKPRSIVVSVAMMGTGAKEDSTTLSLALVNLGNTARSRNSDSIVKNRVALEAFKSGWLSGIALSSESAKILKGLDMGGESSINATPVTFAIKVTETENGNRALKFIGEVLSTVKKDVATTISQDVFKDRDAEEKAEGDADELSRNEEDTAFSNYLQAKVDYTRKLAEKKRIDADPASTDEQKQAIAYETQIKQVAVDKAKRIWCLKRTAMQKRDLVLPDRGEVCPE